MTSITASTVEDRRADNPNCFPAELQANLRIRDEPHEPGAPARQPARARAAAQLDKTRPRVPPETALGKVLGYLDNHWSGLTRFLDDRRIETGNNAAEDAIHPFVVARRNWLFRATPAGDTAGTTSTP